MYCQSRAPRPIEWEHLLLFWTFLWLSLLWRSYSSASHKLGAGEIWRHLQSHCGAEWWMVSLVSPPMPGHHLSGGPGLNGLNGLNGLEQPIQLSTTINDTNLTQEDHWLVLRTLYWLMTSHQTLTQAVILSYILYRSIKDQLNLKGLNFEKCSTLTQCPGVILRGEPAHSSWYHLVRIKHVDGGSSLSLSSSATLSDTLYQLTTLKSPRKLHSWPNPVKTKPQPQSIQLFAEGVISRLGLVIKISCGMDIKLVF